MAEIHSKVPTEEFRSNFDRIFGKKESESEHQPVLDKETCLLFGAFGEDKVQFIRGGEVLLEISNKTFYVRGRQVEQDAAEATLVYAAFKEFVGINSYGLSETPNGK